MSSRCALRVFVGRVELDAEILLRSSLHPLDVLPNVPDLDWVILMQSIEDELQGFEVHDLSLSERSFVLWWSEQKALRPKVCRIDHTFTGLPVGAPHFGAFL